MDYLKSLTIKQWLIVFAIVLFFIVSYFVFFKKSPQNQTADALNKLMQQGNAAATIDESLTKAEIQNLLKQGAVATTSPGQKNVLTNEEKDALFKLMSPKR